MFAADTASAHNRRRMSAQHAMAPNQRRTLGGVLAIVGGALTALGAFLPWVKATAVFVGTITRSGMEGGDGPIFLGAGLVIAALGLWSVIGRPSAAPVLLVLAGLVVGGFALVDYNEVSQRVGDLGSNLATASVGAGIWSLFAGAAASAIAGLILVGQMTAAPIRADAPPLPATRITTPPVLGAVRECPYCKEAMRRDASVCPHCRRESLAWEFDDGRWWTHDPAGARVWFDETHRRWRLEEETPNPHGTT